jgi:hypothetical protein
MSGITFQSFFMAGFECSSHRRPDGVRLDLLDSTGHAALAAEDYRACAAHGLLTARDGLRWHLIEQVPGRYDWSSWLPMLEAAAQVGIEVIWDLLHYGSPDHLDRAAPTSPMLMRSSRPRRCGCTGGDGTPRLGVPNQRDFLFHLAVRTATSRGGPEEPGGLSGTCPNGAGRKRRRCAP